jgi:hypothetical protein
MNGNAMSGAGYCLSRHRLSRRGHDKIVVSFPLQSIGHAAAAALPPRIASTQVPPTDRENRQDLLWSLHARRSTAKCVLRAESTWTELVILQDEEVAFREHFADENAARSRAVALHARLLEKGWKQAG